MRLGSAMARVLLMAVLAAPSAPAGAWSNHALCTWQALAAMPGMAAAAPVKVERLETFLAAEAPRLEALLQQEEEWARKNVPRYPPRPDALAFRAADATPAELAARFRAALRINPESRLTLFLQLPPGQGAAGRPTLPWTEVTTLKRHLVTQSIGFLALQEGELAPVADVIATASDEPDYGFDLGLWEDNGTPHGKAYGLGKQPFGNPALEFSSQAPMHIGYYHESAILYKAAPFLARTYPEYRIHLYRSLAAHALRSGHPYWGWRFAGWALHHLQDLTQPYHARVLPGVSVLRTMWVNALDLAGLHGAKDHAITLVSNRHFAIENYHFQRVRSAYLRRDFDDAALRALRDSAHDGNAAYTDDTPRHGVAREAHALADSLDATLEASLPAKYISDPAYTFGETESGVDLYALVERSDPAARAAMTAALAPLLAHFGEHTRALVRSLGAPRP
jgi:hypothetical protein